MTMTTIGGDTVDGNSDLTIVEPPLDTTPVPMTVSTIGGESLNGDSDLTIVEPPVSESDVPMTVSTIGGEDLGSYAGFDDPVASDYSAGYLDAGGDYSGDLTGLLDAQETAYAGDMNLASLTQEPEPTYEVDHSY